MKEKKIYVLLAIIPVFFILYYCSVKSEKSSVFRMEEKPSSYRSKMEGLSFWAMDNGRKVMAIRADRFVVKNMKLGFFSFSMVKVAALDNVTIDIYSAKGNGHGDTRREVKSGPHRTKPSLDFKGAISTETFSSFPAQGITSIEAAPIVVTLYDDETIITRISAKTAKVHFRDREIGFDGDVKVVSGQRELRCESLQLSPADGMMKASQYRMTEAGKNNEGRHLKTDLLLKRQ